MRIVIIVQGGIVQEVFTDALDAEVVIVDHDTEMVEERHITLIEPENEALIHSFPVLPLADLDLAVAVAIKEVIK